MHVVPESLRKIFVMGSHLARPDRAMRKLQKVPAEGTGYERFRGVASAIGIKSEAHEHFPAHAHARDVLVEPSLCALCLNEIDERVVIKVYRIRRDRERSPLQAAQSAYSQHSASCNGHKPAHRKPASSPTRPAVHQSSCHMEKLQPKLALSESPENPLQGPCWKHNKASNNLSYL